MITSGNGRPMRQTFGCAVRNAGVIVAGGVVDASVCRGWGRSANKRHWPGFCSHGAPLGGAAGGDRRLIKGRLLFLAPPLYSSQQHIGIRGTMV